MSSALDRHRRSDLGLGSGSLAVFEELSRDWDDLLLVVVCRLLLLLRILLPLVVVYVALLFLLLLNGPSLALLR